MNNFPTGFNFIRKLIYTFTNLYFRPVVSGLENIPNAPCLLVGNHNAIVTLCPEIWIFGSHYFLKHDKLKVLGHDLVLRVPLLRSIAKSYLRYIPNNLQEAKRALEDQAHVLVFPGGGWESCRPSKDRDIINFNGRSGFIKLALEAGVPIIPIVSTGAHDGLYILKRGARIAEFLGLKKFFRIDTFPLGLSFPFVLHIGPLFPFIPLPRKVILSILPSIDVNQLQGETNEQRAQEVIKSIQERMNEDKAHLKR